MNQTLETRIRSEVLHPAGAFVGSDASTPPLHSLRVSRVTEVETFADDRARRILNVVLAALGLVVAAPLMVVIALLVRLSSPGPIFYTQTRVGVDRRNPLDLNGNGRRKVNYGGKLFRIDKFRTMRPSDNAPQVWASPNDSRITPIGRVLRKYRLDELPQLVNVLRGEMNIVGPRPEQPNIFMQLRGEIDGYDQRQRVLPGITGLAQISHHYDACVDDVRRKLSFDLEYIGRESALEALRILLRTVPVILFRRGAW